MAKHQKHVQLSRPALGQFGRLEWAILGTPCGNIQQLAGQLIQRLSDDFSLAYSDADHKADEAARPPALQAGARAAYTDKITHHQLAFTGKMEKYQYRPLLNGVFAVLVNGNHFVADRQIVVLHPRKKDSLQRKLDRLTRVELILTTPEQAEPWDFLKDQLEDWENIPRLPFGDFERIANWLKTRLEANVPPVNGLILAGGKSQRMGKDKGALEYHGKPQREYLAELLADHCREVFLSTRPGQEVKSAFPLLEDSFLGLGPKGAILSAFRHRPNAAWLVAACDLPLLGQQAIRQLLEQRNPSRVATAFYNPATEFPEPLITLWEPRAYPVLLQFLAQGFSCPRKVLINTDIEMIHPADPQALTNVNTPEEYDRVLKTLGVQ